MRVIRLRDPDVPSKFIHLALDRLYTENLADRRVVVDVWKREGRFVIKIRDEFGSPPPSYSHGGLSVSSEEWSLAGFARYEADGCLAFVVPGKE